MRAAILPITLLLAACGSGGSGADSSQAVTTTKMDDIDSIQGTISDELAPSDESTEEALTDANAPDALGSAAAARDKARADAKAKASAKSGTAIDDLAKSSTDVPPPGTAAPAEPAPSEAGAEAN